MWPSEEEREFRPVMPRDTSNHFIITGKIKSVVCVDDGESCPSFYADVVAHATPIYGNAFPYSWENTLRFHFDKVVFDYLISKGVIEGKKSYVTFEGYVETDEDELVLWAEEITYLSEEPAEAYKLEDRIIEELNKLSSHETTPEECGNNLDKIVAEVYGHAIKKED